MNKWLVSSALIISLTACNWETRPTMGEVTRKQTRPGTVCTWDKPVQVQYTHYRNTPGYHGWVIGFKCMTKAESDLLKPGSQIELK